MFSVVFLQKYGWYIIFGLIALSFVKKNLERHIQVSQVRFYEKRQTFYAVNKVTRV